MKMKNKNTGWIIGGVVVAVIIIILVVVSQQEVLCAKKYQQVMIPPPGSQGNLQCCEGLEPKSLHSKGSAWCMEQNCEVECKFAGTKSEGLYDSCTGELIKYMVCAPGVQCLGEDEFCLPSAGLQDCCKDLVCESPCFCDDKGRLTCATTVVCMNPSDIITSCQEKIYCDQFMIENPECNEAQPFLWKPVCGVCGGTKRTYANDCVACAALTKYDCGVSYITYGECV